MDDIMGEVERSKSEINELINQLSPPYVVIASK